MRRFLDRLASLPIIFISGACEAQMVYAPCELPIVAMAPIHFATHPVKRHVAHRGGRRGAQHALHLVAGASMCAVWIGGEGETNGLADAFARDFGGDSPFGGGGYGGDEGGEGAGGFGGGGEGGGSDAAPIFLVDAPALPPIGLIIPPPDCCGPTPAPLAAPIPEPSTWLMLIAGLSALGFLKWKRFA